MQPALQETTRLEADGTSAAPARPVWLAVLGPDGSGKSTLISELRRWLATRDEPLYLHFRPRTGLATADPTPVTDPHGQRPRGRTASRIKLMYYVVDYVAGAATLVRPALGRGRSVIFDRYYHDIWADPVRYRYAGPRSDIRRLSRLVPAPDLTLILDVPADVLQARKPEVHPSESARARQAYAELATWMPRARLLDGDRPIAEVAREARRMIGELRNRRPA